MNTSAERSHADISPELTIGRDTVSYLTDKLREYDARTLLPFEPEDDEQDCVRMADYDALEEHEGDYLNEPLLQELHCFLDDLSDDEKIDLVALVWLGRNELTADSWPQVRQEAVNAFNARTVDYLLGTPGVAELIEGGLAAMAAPALGD